MRHSHKVVAGAAAAALALGLGAGATMTPQAFAEPAAAPAAAAPAATPSSTDATHPDNVKMALHFLDQINNQVRSVERSALTEQQIATAQGVNASDIQPGTGTGEILPLFKVNSDLTKWAQTRANELAQAGMIDGHKNIWNGAPSWAIQTCMQPGGGSVTCSNMFSSPKYQSGTYVFGPENLAIASRIVTNYQRYNPIWGWTDELNTGAQAYGHYLLEITKLGNVAGAGVARVTNGRFAGGIVTVLEVAYEAPGTQHGTTQTVDEALKALAAANEIQSVKVPNAVTVDSGMDPSSQFPEKVTATYGDGHTAEVDVTWAKPEETKYKDRKGGPFTVHGTIDGFTKGVDITVNVNPATVESVEQPKDVTIKVGEKLSLPETLTVTWSNDETTTAQPAWDTSAVDTTKAGNYTATTTVEGKTITVKVTVIAASITDLKNPTDVTVPSGATVDALKAKLPTSVEASYDNNTTGNVSVTWTEPSDADQQTLKDRNGGKFTLQGTVNGTDKTVTVTVKVTAATPVKAELKNTTVTTPSGTAPELPEKATVTWSNGDTSEEAVTWNPLSEDQKNDVKARGGEEFYVSGTAQGKPVEVRVVVSPATVTEVAKLAPVTTKAKAAPQLPKTVKVHWSNGDVTDETITWTINSDTYAKRGEKDVTGEILSGTSNYRTVTVHLTVTAVIDAVTNPDPITVESGTDPATTDKLPKTVKVHWSDDVIDDAKVTWDASKKADYSKREGGTYTLAGTVEGTSTKAVITVKVNPATVTEVTAEPAEITVVKGSKVSGLPGTVDVAYSNGESVKMPVTWDTSAVKTDTVGDYTATATVEGKTVTITVKVVDAAITKVEQPKDVTVPSGTKADALALPATIKATLSNDTTSDVTVKWADLTADQKATLASRKGGSFTVEGTVAGWKDKVTVKVIVTPATADSATLAEEDKTVTTDSGKTPALPKTATVTYPNGEKAPAEITWDDLTKEQQATLASRAGGTFQVNGTAEGKTVVVTVKVNPATPSKVTTDTVEITTQVGTVPALPDTLPVVWSNGDETDEPVTWDEVKAEQYAKAGSFEVDGTVNVADTAVPATASGAAVTPSLRVALRAAKAGEPVGKTFPVTAKVTVTDQPVTPVEEPAQPADGTKSATDKADKGIKATVRTLARTGGSLLILPLAAGLVAAGAILVRRRQA